MELLKESILKKVINYISEPRIVTEVNKEEELGVFFYTIFLEFSDIKEPDLFRKELSFILRDVEVQDVVDSKRFKLEDVFAKYIQDDDRSEDMAKPEAVKIAESYSKLVKSEYMLQ